MAWLSSSFIFLCGLVETRVSITKFKSITYRIRNNWDWTNNYNADSGGRIWCGWDPIKIEVTIIISKHHMILLQVVIRGTVTKFFISFVYAKNTDGERKQLWKDLEDSVQWIDGPWLLLGDWNVVRYNNEKKGGRRHAPRVFASFNNTIDKLYLTNMPTANSVFTWCNKRYSNRRIYAKLDKGLMNEDWALTYPDLYVLLTPPLTSDHWGLCVKVPVNIASGPKPFRFLLIWNKQPVVKDLVAASWGKQFKGEPIAKLMVKLKLCKQAVKQWNIEKFGSVYAEVISCRKKLAEIQGVLADDPMNEDVIHKEDAVVTKEEVKSTIFAMGADRAPGPDGFSARFFQQYWSIVGDDFTKAVMQFFHNPVFGKGVNSTFITLIKKKKDAIMVEDYRPISLCNVFYKVVAKILANRLATVLSKIVGNEQTAFI
ncbi:uncharacterized protein LOC132304932 [Cornus florida]|uniref:uncharacterized protein LOC132304932 n=1 Tax=Cornus florida TaxID=4283 RepID=UPI0028A2185E|nr:uncharacterized protein LOC132304932 [Cornus florida]